MPRILGLFLKARAILILMLMGVPDTALETTNPEASLAPNMGFPEVLILETSADQVDMQRATRIAGHIPPPMEVAIYDRPTPQITTMKQGTMLDLPQSTLTLATLFRSHDFPSLITLHRSSITEIRDVCGKTPCQKHLINDLSQNSSSTVYVGSWLQNRKRTRFLRSRLVQVSISFVVII
jgi:hypothetical protein